MHPVWWVVAAALVAWNAAMNLTALRRAYVPANLGLTILLVIGATSRGLSLDSLGLGPASLGQGAAWGGAVIVAVAAGYATVFAVRPLRRFLRDERVAGYDRRRVTYETLVRIPLGTVVLEEVAFRGVLLAAFAGGALQGGALHGGALTAAVVTSSALFGLWHVGPAIQLVRMNQLAATPGRVAAWVVLAVVVTAAGGVGFCLLRLGAGSLAAPLLAHWALNGLGTVAAATAHRSAR